MVTDLDPNPAVRMERARSDFVKGTVRPDAPGMVYYPALPDLCGQYDLELSVMKRKAIDDDWLGERKKAMATSLVTPFSAAVDANPEIVKRADMVVREMESFDDKVFGIANRGIAIMQRVFDELEKEDDPARALRQISSAAKTLESFHQTAKRAYDPQSVRPENTVNVNVMNIEAAPGTVADVARILANAEQRALAAGVTQEEIDTIEAEIVGDEDEL